MNVSIIMAVKDGEKTLSTAIESILNQTYRDFEFIIINDASKDKTLEIIENYSRKDNRIKFFNNKFNIGLTKTLNLAIKLSKGKYIARQDADDISLPNRIKTQIEFMEKNPDYAFCGCDIKINQDTKSFINTFQFNEIKKTQIIKNCFAHPTIIIRKEILNKFGNYNEKLYYGQDFELWCRLIYKYNLKAKNLKEKLLIFSEPSNKLILKDKSKILTQLKNQIITSLRYMKFVNNKIKLIKSIFELSIKYFYIILFSKA